MEQWKDIPGYEGIYQASTEGRIRTAEGKVTSNARYSTRVWKQRILKQKYSNRKGTDKKDARISLWKDGKEKTHLVARLIALTWCKNYKEGFTVNHIDGNPLNNNAKNLEWISLADNIRHGFDTGLYKMQKACVLTDVKGHTKRYKSQAEASVSLGRSPAYIANCKSQNRPIISINGERYDYSL